MYSNNSLWTCLAESGVRTHRLQGGGSLATGAAPRTTDLVRESQDLWSNMGTLGNSRRLPFTESRFELAICRRNLEARPDLNRMEVLQISPGCKCCCPA